MPVSGDTAVVGSQSTANINGLATAADIAVLVVTDAYTGDIGANGDPLIFIDAGGQTMEVRYEGRGRIWIANDNSNVVFDDFKVNTTNKATDAVNIDGTTTSLWALSGYINITDTVVTIQLDWVRNAASDVILDLTSAATVTTIRGQGGVVTSAADVANLILKGGGTATFTQGDIAASGVLELDHSTLIYNTSGGTIGSSGTIDVWNGGRLDLTKSGNSRTLDPGAGGIIVHSGGVIDGRGIENSITVSNPPILKGKGASIKPGGLGGTPIVFD